MIGLATWIGRYASIPVLYQIASLAWPPSAGLSRPLYVMQSSLHEAHRPTQKADLWMC